MMMENTMHKWEVLGMGSAPYRLVDVLETPDVIDLLNPAHALVMAKEYGLGLGCCDVCGHGLKENYILRNAEGGFFKVGSDCVLKISGVKQRVSRDPLVRQVKREVAKRRNQKRKERENAKIEAAVAKMPEIENQLKALPHPLKWRADNGDTEWDWAVWMLKNSGNAGKLKVVRVINEVAKEK